MARADANGDSFTDQCFGNTAANAFRAAGDDCSFVFEVHSKPIVSLWLSVPRRWSTTSERFTTEARRSHRDTENSIQLFTQPLIHNLRIRFPFRSFHHLSDEESKQGFFPGAILLELIWTCGDYFVNHSIDFAGVAHLDEPAFFDNRRCGLAC